MLIALFACAYFARDLILPIVLGFLLALTLSPLARFLHRLGLPHVVAAVILVLATTSATLLIIGASAGTVAVWMDDLPRVGAEIKAKLHQMTEAVKEVREVTKEVEKIGSEDAGTPEVIVQQPGLFDSAFDTLTQIGATFAVTMVLALLLLASGPLFYLKLVQSFPTFAGKRRALSTVYNIERRVSRYLLTITLINAALGLAVGAYMTALGLPNGLVWGVAAFVLNFLPYLGGLIGSALVAAMAVLSFDSLAYALLAPLGYLVLTVLEGNFLTPWLVGKRLSMNTVAVFLTVVIWGWLWGVPGALVAVPFLVVFKVICENFEALKVVGLFLSADEEQPPKRSAGTRPAQS